MPGCEGARGEPEVECEFCGRKSKFLGKSYESTLGVLSVSLKDIQGETSNCNWSLRRKFEAGGQVRESSTCKGWFKTMATDEITCGVGLSQGTKGWIVKVVLE